MIEGFVLKIVGVLHGVALKILIVKWKTFRRQVCPRSSPCWGMKRGATMPNSVRWWTGHKSDSWYSSYMYINHNGKQAICLMPEVHSRSVQFMLFNPTHKRPCCMYSQNHENVLYADWPILLLCCDSFPGKNTYCLGNTGISKLVLAICIIHCWCIWKYMYGFPDYNSGNMVCHAQNAKWHHVTFAEEADEYKLIERAVSQGDANSVWVCRVTGLRPW